MKAVPKVNADGVYLEDELVNDAFNGVVPFYYQDLVTQLEINTCVEDELSEEQQQQPVGYIVGIPVPPGLFCPRFDIAAWRKYQDALTAAESEYQTMYAEWTTQPEEERGQLPVYTHPEQPTLWSEGLSPEEIEELTCPQSPEPTELERLQAENTELKLALVELAESQEADKLEMQLALAELVEIITGGETVG
ncbi:hypothetical protein [Paenibacillus humicus]|uniref:hypothetical protein n=1 Tax=Paenibacillus humicus TaxID=412861 RepID=UPI003D2ABBF7